jgi:hypothetical protein
MFSVETSRNITQALAPEYRTVCVYVCPENSESRACDPAPFIRLSRLRYQPLRPAPAPPVAPALTPLFTLRPRAAF